MIEEQCSDVRVWTRATARHPGLTIWVGYGAGDRHRGHRHAEKFSTRVQSRLPALWTTALRWGALERAMSHGVEARAPRPCSKERDPHLCGPLAAQHKQRLGHQASGLLDRPRDTRPPEPCVRGTAGPADALRGDGKAAEIRAHRVADPANLKSGSATAWSAATAGSTETWPDRLKSGA